MIGWSAMCGGSGTIPIARRWRRLYDGALTQSGLSYRVSENNRDNARTLTASNGRTDAEPVSWRELLLVAGMFAILTIAYTYPQVRYLATHSGNHYDALFGVWRVAWIAHQLAQDPVHLFDANIFYPERGTFAYSDAVLLPGLSSAVLIWLGTPTVVAHNLLLLISFVASGVTMYMLARCFTRSVLAGAFAGVVFAFQPFRFAHYSQLEVLWGWWIPLAFWALHRVLTRKRVTDGVLLGAIVAMQAWSSIYYAVFLMTGLAALSVVLLIRWPLRKPVGLTRPTVAAALVCVVLVGPYLVPYWKASRIVGGRGQAETREWSATLSNYLAVPGQNWLYGRTTARFGSGVEGIMFPGLVAIVLAVVGAGPPWNRRRLAYVVLLIVAFDLSLGFNGFTYRVFYPVMWPYHALRVPARMFVVVSAALAILAAEGLKRISDRIPGRLARRSFGVVATTLALLESASTPLALTPIPVPPVSVYSWLRTQPPSVVLEWPVPHASTLGLTREPLYMYYSTLHWHRLVNGYSGFYPEVYIRSLDVLETFPDREAVQRLRRLGVAYVILHSEFAPERYVQLRNQLVEHPDFESIMVERTGVQETTVFRLRVS